MVNSTSLDQTNERSFQNLILLSLGGVHHWDENGLADHSKEPAEIQEIHAAQVEFVKAWLADFKPPSVSVPLVSTGNSEQYAVAAYPVLSGSSQ